MCSEPEYLTIPWFLRRNPAEARKQMNKIKKALNTLSKTDNPIIKSDMIKVLREQFIHLENSFDASCNHNGELVDDNEKLRSILKEADEYLSSNNLNSIGSGSILHQKLKNT